MSTSTRALVFASALASTVAACSPGAIEQAPPACVEVVARVELDAGTVCASTPTGLILRSFGPGGLVVERLGGGSGVELTKLADFPGADVWRCGEVVEDPSAGTIWVVQPGELDPWDAPPVPDLLHELDADGQLRETTTLELDGDPMRINSLMVLEGDLILAGHVERPEGSWLDHEQSVGLLERRGPDGELRWRQLGYAGSFPEPSTPSHWTVDGIGRPVASAGEIAFMAAIAGIDSSSEAMYRVRADTGELIWAELLRRDTFWSGGTRLDGAGDGEGEGALYVSTQQRARWDYTSAPHAELLVPPLSLLTRYEPDGTIRWEAEVEWPEQSEPFGQASSRLDELIVQAVSVRTPTTAAEPPRPAELHLLGFTDEDGALACRTPAAELGLHRASTLTRLESGELLLAGPAGELEADTPTLLLLARGPG
jgi:hypothetical protein